MPLFYQPLEEWAAEDHQSVAEYVQDAGVLWECLRSLSSWCREQLSRSEQQPLIDQVLRLAQQTAVLETNQLLLNRYHTALDNQLYRALKALRETQQWRLSALESALESKTVA